MLSLTYAALMRLRIKELREERGLSQQDLGEMAGISRSQVSEIETQKKPANTLRLTAIARCLGISVNDLFEVGAEEAYQRMIVDLMKDMAPDDREALIRHAKALVRRD